MKHIRRAPLVLALIASFALGACGSSNGAEEDDSLALDTKPRMMTTREGDFLVEQFDLDGDGTYDVIKYIETYQDPDNPDVTKRRIRKKKIDLNTDGTYDVQREYDKEGVIQVERVDNDLDGTYDVINHFENGSLKRKQVLADNGERVVTERLYSAGKVSKVKKDTNNDGKFDHFEYYKDGNLQRIGRDQDGDEKIDKWVYR